MTEEAVSTRRSSVLSLIPFVLFFIFYFGLSIYARDFYCVPMPVAFLVASACGIAMMRRCAFTQRVDIYAKGMGDSNIMLMCLIVILAGAFASVASKTGAVDAAVTIARNLIPDSLMLTGVFAVACFISLAIGTSCGTIATLTSIALGLGEASGSSPVIMLGAVVGGAMFGDNLSMISDTTIAATRTQGVAMRDKFLTNIWIALPAALITMAIYLANGFGSSGSAAAATPVTFREIILVTPYIMILILSLCRVNVMALLFAGTVLAGIIGICMGKFGFMQMLGHSGSGALAMSETLVVALLAGGLLAVVKYNGGIEYIISKVETKVSSAHLCEAGIALLVCGVNLVTANNTVALVVAGPIARELSLKFQCSPRRIASVIDTSSCITQGMIPYGAQVLSAVGIAKECGYEISALSLIGSMYYQWLLLVTLIAGIIV
ncbi:MAG: hypothetical protein J6S21_05610, partial [Victivallales bacterium]|nr:hypothetical protein [Victivallales bacterium]